MNQAPLLDRATYSGALADFAFLQKLSGRKQVAAIIRWLNKNKIPYFIQASGHPVASMDAINDVLLPQGQPRLPPVFPLRFDLIKPRGWWNEHQKKQRDVEQGFLSPTDRGRITRR